MITGDGERRTRLRAAGLRATDQRVAVLEALGGHPHADTQNVFDTVRIALPDVTVGAAEATFWGFCPACAVFPPN